MAESRRGEPQGDAAATRHAGRHAAPAGAAPVLGKVVVVEPPRRCLAAVFGMSVLPSALQQTWVFFVALAGMFIVSTVLIVVMRWRRWL